MAQGWKGDKAGHRAAALKGWQTRKNKHVPAPPVDEKNSPPFNTRLGMQWHAVKRKYPGALVAMRIGDFYEFMGNDAQTAGRVAGIYTTRLRGRNYDLAGVPHHVSSLYFDRLTSAGYRVVAIDQTGEPLTRKEVATPPKSSSTKRPRRPR